MSGMLKHALKLQYFPLEAVAAFIEENSALPDLTATAGKDLNKAFDKLHEILVNNEIITADAT